MKIIEYPKNHNKIIKTITVAKTTNFTKMTKII